MEFGGFEGVVGQAGFGDDIFEVEYSTDATGPSDGTWTNLSFDAAEPITNNWQNDVLVTSSMTESASAISLRFISDVGDVGRPGDALRIDDVTVVGIPEPSTFVLIAGLLGLSLGMLRRRRQ